MNLREGSVQRREFLRALGASGLAAALGGCAATMGRVGSAGRVVVVGGGYGGATAAKYLNLWSEGASCSMSFLAIRPILSAPLLLGGRLRMWPMVAR